MRKLLLGVLFCTSLFIQGQTTTSSDNSNTETATMKENKLLRHVVLFKFKKEATAEKISEIEAAFAALPGKISEVHSFEWGLNNSPEGLNKGFTHCYFVSFKSEKDREIYIPHPEHQAFVSILKPALEDVLVVDYWN